MSEHQRHLHPSNDPGRSEGEEVARERLELRKLRAKLLDLSKRNRLLNYKYGSESASAISVVDEIPAEVFRILVTEQRMMRFRPTKPREVELFPTDSTVTTSDDNGDVDLDVPLPLDAQGGEPAPRHTDTQLQTRLTPERLDHVLRRIADRVELIREEQGVNTLFLALGMLHYYEAESSDEVRRAPLLLVPVELKRASARAAYRLMVGEDEVVLNPALWEHVKHTYGVILPDLPENEDQIDLASLFGAIQGAVGRYQRWQVTDDIALSPFSFLKYVMYKDLETNEEVFASHRLFKILLERRGQGMLGLPDDIRTMDLDRQRPPEATSEVLDADSSQQRAIAAVVKGYDVVIEGPPGTGKSQTIVNILANALADRKTVLFVSEKRAALEVVHRRLQSVGLGTYCLELHSQKASKREVIRELRRALDHTLSVDAIQTEAARRLPTSRTKLTRYSAAVHARHSPLGLSVFEAVGRLAEVRSAPHTPWSGEASSVTREAFEAGDEAISTVVESVGRVGDPALHAWRGTSLATMEELWGERWERFESLLRRIAELSQELLAAGHTARESLGVEPPQTVNTALDFSKLAELLAAAPGAPIAVLTDPEWNKPPRAADDLLAVGRRVAERRSQALCRFDPKVLDRPHGADIALVRRYHRKMYRMLVPSYRRVRRDWHQSRLPTYRVTLGQQADHFREVDALRADLARLAKDDKLGARLFGGHWRGADSDWEGLDRYARWVVEFRAACVGERLHEHEAAQAFSAGAPDVAPLRRVATLATSLATALGEAARLVGWPDDYLCDLDPGDVAKRARAILEAAGGRGEWVAYLRARENVEQTIAAQSLLAADTGDVPYAETRHAFRRSFFEAWLAERIREEPVLREFQRSLHEADIDTFRRWDAAVLVENRQKMAAELATDVQERVKSFIGTAALAFLQGQFARQRGHAPVRKLLRQSFPVVRAIKPCFLMSPLMVAQCLEPGAHDFDLVIFDEASQLTPEDAVGSVVRGKQLAVVGDPKQLPPTTFFNVQVGLASDDGARETSGELEDLESILEQYQAAGLPTARLRWHYRSAHESLIAFSNAHIYDWDLLTFPCTDAGTHCVGLEFKHVPDGCYLGRGLNLVEARTVADAVIEHARRHPDATLGVGTFNLPQQLALQDELERRRREDPSLEDFFRSDREEPFFVKNLENIQGDERDVIFLSVTYGKAEDGALRHHFGPINGPNGWRRLNVLVTRARNRLAVYSSMRGDEIDLTRTQARGAVLLRDFLLWAERRQLIGAALKSDAKSESPFEREVLRELTNRGVRVVPQVGVGRYRIDIGVLDNDVRGRFLCGIECDGAAYHQSETARDRDRLREDVLRKLGWTIHRVWSTDWFKFRQGQVERLLGLIEASREAARQGAHRHIAPLHEHPAGSPSDLPNKAGPQDESPRPARARSASVAVGHSYHAAELLAVGAPAEMLGASANVLRRLLLEVLRVEAPIHEEDLFSRLASAWGVKRVGSRIEARVQGVLRAMHHNGQVRWDRPFVTLPDTTVKPRSRAGTAIPADRIAPEEYRAAIVAVLATGPRPEGTLMTDTRKLLGFDRTGARLEALLREAIEALTSEGRVGLAGDGLALRDGPARADSPWTTES